MNRREAISRVGLLVGGTVIGANAFLTGCAPKRSEVPVGTLDFSPENIAFLDEVGETILPKTAASGGAKEAKIGDFMKAIVTDCAEENEQKVFMETFGKINEASNNKFSKNFMELSPEEKTTLLTEIDKESKDYMASKKPDEPSHYFTYVKQLTLWGYFTSEVGSKQALRWLPVPGKYDGCYPYKKGDKAWAQI
jgi:hypothetical protein